MWKCIRNVWIFAFVLVVSSSAAESEKAYRPTVRVMTRNMDEGTDMLYVTDPNTFAYGAYLTYAEVLLAAHLPERAAELAAEIAAVQPDLVALQEVAIWHLEGDLGNADYDQLQLLQTALESAGLHYRVAVIQTLTVVSVRIPQMGLVVEFTDRDAILVRADLPPGQLDVTGTETHVFTHLLPFETPMGPIPVLRGWIAADVKIRGARFKFVDAHLETTWAGNFEYTAWLQLQQAMELVEGLNNTRLPVILAGDFNSDAEDAGIGPDQTESAAFISGAGYVDAWHQVYPDQRGFTWGWYLEDQPPPNFVVPSTPCERIDLIFAHGPRVLSVQQTGTAPGESGFYTSDHIGVVADYQLSVGR